MPEEKCRWAVAAILAENDESVDEDVRLAYEKEKYKFMSLPKVESSVNCVYPYTTMISIYVAIKRVYPAMHDYVTVGELFLSVYLFTCVHAYIYILYNDATPGALCTLVRLLNVTYWRCFYILHILLKRVSCRLQPGCSNHTAY